MATKIEWCQETWNPITGCSKISPGCANCYAERMAKRMAGRFGYPADDPFAVTLHESQLNKPFKWRKPRMVFVCSMGDLFHEDVPFEWINLVISKIFNAHRLNPNHKWLFLTKRPERVLDWREWVKTKTFATAGQVLAWFQHKAWFGVTAENQEQADKRIPILLQIPAAVRFVSVEPMLGPVDLESIDYPDGWRNNKKLNALTGFEHPTEFHHKRGGSFKVLPSLDWVICGGESGPGARPMHPEWVRSLRNQCIDAGVPFFFKQWGEYVESVPCDEESAKSHLIFDDYSFYRIGKKKAGRILDGRTWDQFPEVA